MRLVHSFPTPYHFKPTSLGILRQEVHDRDPRKFRCTNEAVRDCNSKKFRSTNEGSTGERNFEKFKCTNEAV
jgi:hypothetical protein